MPDRESFIAAIAANPADDLPRLVFADWLDEHGDPERAEFIRTQIRWHHATDEEEKQHLNRRAAELFRDHWQRWLRPFLMALNPATHVERGYQSDATRLPAREVILTRNYAVSSADTAFLHLHLTRGGVSKMQLRVYSWDARASLGEVFRCEPVDQLALSLSSASPRWSQFTHPSLRRVQSLGISEHTNGDGSTADCVGAFDDPHLAGVRELSLSVKGTEPVHANRQSFPAGTLVRFARSPLAYRLSGLTLLGMDEQGVRVMARSNHRLRLERLKMNGSLTPEAIKSLEEGGFAETVRGLNLHFAKVDDPGVALLSRGDWRRLNLLDLSSNQLSSAALPALASAVFTPQLTTLDLSDNRLFFDQPADLNGLRALAEVLDPERLQHLNLTNTGLTTVPDFLAERFGDRVTV